MTRVEPMTAVHQVKTFLDLIKFAHTLFALPFALTAAVLALRTRGAAWSDRQTWELLGLIILCMILARTYAMTVNRLLDRRFDAVNPRTARRPSVTGAVSPAFMTAVIALCAAAFVGTCFLFYHAYGNPWPAVLSGPVLLWLGLYSLTKRFTALCHFWLGISLGLAPVSAWIALVPPAGPVLSWSVIFLGMAVVFWVGGFDILYALQDEDMDRSLRLHSIPAMLGRRGALWLSRLCHLLTVAALTAFGIAAALHWPYWVAMGIVAGLLAVEQSLVRENDISKINLAFMTVNGTVGLVFGTLAVIDIVWMGT